MKTQNGEPHTVEHNTEAAEPKASGSGVSNQQKEDYAAKMEDVKPISYDNSKGIEAFPELHNLEKLSFESMIKIEKEYFNGVCSNCYTYITRDFQELLVCSGCQLVGYCSKACQKKHWSKHRSICKLFPVKSGRNIFFSSTKKFYNGKHLQTYVESLHEQVKVKSDNGKLTKFISTMFTFSRICGTCGESNPERLTDCECGCVVYCCGACSAADEQHTLDCNSLRFLPKVNKHLWKNYKDLNLNYFTKVSKVFEPLEPFTANLSMDLYHVFLNTAYFDPEMDMRMINEDQCDVKATIMSERLAYPLTILYSLQELSIGPDKKSLWEVESLDIHILSPLAMLDPKIWELFLHRLPKLKELNIAFIGPTMLPYNHLNLDILQKLVRCSDCASKGRLISFYIHPIEYHMFSSSLEYNEPDAVAIFSFREIFRKSEEDSFHIKTSLRNITYSEDTVVILSDAEESWMEENIEMVNKVRPVEIVMETKENMFRGYDPSRHPQKGIYLLNSRKFIACVKQK